MENLISFFVTMTAISEVIQVIIFFVMCTESMINSKTHAIKLLIPCSWTILMSKFLWNLWKELPYKDDVSKSKYNGGRYDYHEHDDA